MVPVASGRVSRARPYSGVVRGRSRDFAYGAFTLCGVRFHVLPLSTEFCHSPFVLRYEDERSYNPIPATPAGYYSGMVWAVPVSLATTQGIEISFCSSGYLDVSVRPLTSTAPMDSVQGTRALPRVGFPIRKSPDQRLFSVSPGLIAAVHVLHRLLMPRHPPCALIHLIRK